MISNLWKKTPPPPKGEDANAQSAKARLVLDLIERKVLPSPSSTFTEELTKMAAGGPNASKADRNSILGSLGKHLQGYPNKAKSPPAKAPKARPAASLKAKPAQKPASPPEPKIDMTLLDKMSTLEDQHPAVIEQRLSRMSPEERKAQLSRLTGEAARHVSLLSWQREAASKPR